MDEVKTDTERDNNKSKAKEREATKPVTEKDNEVTDDKETKTDNNEDDNENEAETKSEDQEIREPKVYEVVKKLTKPDNNEDDNENEAETKSEDQEKIQISKSFVAITARPTRERGETRAKYMCRLARQFRNRDQTQPTNQEWNELTSPTDTTRTPSSMGSGSDLEDLTESVM